MAINVLSAESRKPLTLQLTITVLLSQFALLLIVAVIGLSVGSVSISFSDVVNSFVNPTVVDAANRTIILDIRLPRLLLAMIVGAGLSIAGVVFQALLRNPLAEPYILGISSGGTVGAIIVITLGIGASIFLTPLASFVGSALVMMLVYSLAHRHGQLDTNSLLLGGVMVGAFFNAAVLLIIAVFNQELRNAFLWLMGNFGVWRKAFRSDA